MKMEIKYTMKKHSSYITHLDFSCDSNYLHSTCGAYELLFWDTNTGRQLTSGATMLRNEKFNTWTTTLGWPVQGIWSPGMDGTDINAVDRSKTTFDKGMKILATGDDNG
jgi:WD40 repeat protein